MNYFRFRFWRSFSTLPFRDELVGILEKNNIATENANKLIDAIDVSIRGA